MTSLLIFILSCFVGYYVISHVCHALHSPLMAITNAISSIIVIAAIEMFIMNNCNPHSNLYNVLAIFFLAINISGGFCITYRMLNMFYKIDT